MHKQAWNICAGCAAVHAFRSELDWLPIDENETMNITTETMAKVQIAYMIYSVSSMINSGCWLSVYGWYSPKKMTHDLH